MRFDSSVDYTREILIMNDEEEIALDWCTLNVEKFDAKTPICIILHGMTGHSREKNIVMLAGGLARANFRVAVFNRWLLNTFFSIQLCSHIDILLLALQTMLRAKSDTAAEEGQVL